MKTPRDKYENDSQYKYFVDILISIIHRAEFTPSEIREMSILACIIYEQQRVRSVIRPHTKGVELALERLQKWVDLENII
jgi:hypothetical protein